MKFISILFLVFLSGSAFGAYSPNAVTSGSTRERVERITGFCGSTSSISRQSGSWVSSVANISSGACGVTIATGVFSAAPTCTVSLVSDQNVSSLVASVALRVDPTATAFTPTCRYTADGTSTQTVCGSFTFEAICMGPR